MNATIVVYGSSTGTCEAIAEKLPACAIDIAGTMKKIIMRRPLEKVHYRERASRMALPYMGGECHAACLQAVAGTF